MSAIAIQPITDAFSMPEVDKLSYDTSADSSLVLVNLNKPKQNPEDFPLHNNSFHSTSTAGKPEYRLVERRRSVRIVSRVVLTLLWLPASASVVYTIHVITQFSLF